MFIRSTRSRGNLAPAACTLEALEPRALLSTVPPNVFDNGQPVTSVVAADFNQDGRMDLAVAAGNEVAMLIARPNGRFKPPRTVALFFDSYTLAVGNFDGNRFPDVVAISNEGGLHVLLSAQRPARFATVLYGSGGNINSVAVANLSGDDRDEIIVTGRSFAGADSLTVFTMGESRVETLRTALHRPDAHLLRAAAADFDGDGDLDLVTVALTAAGSEIIGIENVTLPFEGVEYNVALEPQTLLTFPGTLGPLVAADFNGDEVPDLLTFAFGSGAYNLVQFDNLGGWNFDPADTVANVTPPAAGLIATPTEIRLVPNLDAAPDVIVHERHASPYDGQPQANIRRAVVRQFQQEMSGDFQGEIVWSLRDIQPFTAPLWVGLAQDLTGEGRIDVAWIKDTRLRLFRLTSDAAPPLLEFATHARLQPVTHRQKVRFSFEFYDPTASENAAASNVGVTLFIDVNGNGLVDADDYTISAGGSTTTEGWGQRVSRLTVRQNWPRGTFNVLVRLHSFAAGVSAVYVVDRPLTIV